MITKAFKWVQRLMYLPVSIASVPVTGETVTIPAGATAALVNFNLANGGIANSAGTDLGGFGDSSLTGYATVFTNEVAYGTEDSALANGDFYVDYLTGKARGRKLTSATSMASIAYSYRVMRTGGAVSGDGAVTTATQRVTIGSTSMQAKGRITTGTDAYGDLVTPTANASHIKLGLGGSNDATVTLDNGTTDHMDVEAGSIVFYDAVTIASGVKIRAKNRVGGSNFSNLSCSIW